MLDRDPDLRRILKWAAGSPAGVSDISDVDEDRLLELVAEHRLAQRLLDRLRSDKPAWGRRSLLTRAWGQCQRAGEQMRRHAAALREITQACAQASQPPPIMVKGFSLYALTGNSGHLRYSADMDLFGPSPDRLQDVLRGLGYADAEVELAPHEFAVMERGGVLIEIHAYFPVQRYPDALTPDDCLPERHPGVWWQDEYRQVTPHTKLTYADLSAAATRGAAPESDGLATSDPAMQALVLCAHIFRNVLEGRQPRLCEIADLRDLVGHPQFNATAFRGLTARLGGRDAVRVAAHLERCWLGTRTLPALEEGENWACDARLPQSPGFWVGWRSAEEMLLPPESGDLFARLGANRVEAGGCPEAYSVLGGGAGRAVERVIVRSSGADPLPFGFSLAAAEYCLRFEVTLPQAPADDHQGYHVRFDDEASTPIFFVNIRQGAADHSSAGTAFLCPLEHGYGLTASLPWASLPKPTERGEVALILSVVRDWFIKPGEEHEDRGWFTVPGVLRADPSVRVPLLIHLDHALVMGEKQL